MKSFNQLYQAHQMSKEEFYLASKIGGKAFAASHGVRVPSLLQGPVPIASLKEPDQSEWTSKPNKACTARAVILANREGDGTYFNPLVKYRQKRSWADWLIWQETFRTKSVKASFPDEWLIEERIGPPRSIPTTYAVWCVGGEPMIITQHTIHRIGVMTKSSWNTKWERIKGAVILNRATLPGEIGELPPPLFPNEILYAARVLATAYPGPFTRVDFIEDTNSPVFTEFSTNSAGKQFRISDEWDTLMGEKWR